jgi:hypothetical protein
VYLVGFVIKKSVTMHGYVKVKYHYLGVILCDLAETNLNYAVLQGFDGIGLHYTTIDKGAEKSLGQPGRKQATATENFDFHISYL